MERTSQEQYPSWPITRPLNYNQIGKEAAQIQIRFQELDIETSLSSCCASALITNADNEMRELRSIALSPNNHSRELAGYIVQLEELLQIERSILFPDNVLEEKTPNLEQAIIDSQNELSSVTKIELMYKDPSGISCLEAIVLDKAKKDPAMEKQKDRNLTIGYILAFLDKLHPYTRGRLSAFCHYQKVYAATREIEDPFK